jgi:hypothetical protein
MTTETSTLADPLTELGGMPFLDDGFVPGRLLALVMVLRRQEALRLGLPVDEEAGLRAWLDPGTALLLHPDRPAMPEQDLSSSQQEQAAAVLGGLPRVVPAWEPLLQLPVRYRAYPRTSSYSASIRSWPQHVFLADKAFIAPDQIRSQVVHENCHQWLYLIQEAWSLQTRNERDLTMPSGTSERSLEEVLGGAHVAAALIRMYQALDSDGERDRIAYLTHYLAGCMDVIDHNSSGLTDAGRCIAARIQEAL